MVLFNTSKVRKIELRFSATDLLNKDLFSLSDPFLVCHTVRDGAPHREIGRTETVQDDLNPVWATTFTFDYDPAVHRPTLFVVDLFDRDSPHSHSLAKHDFLGRAVFRLADLLDSPTMHLDLPLRPASTLLSSSSSSVTDTEENEDDHYYVSPPISLKGKPMFEEVEEEDDVPISIKSAPMPSQQEQKQLGSLADGPPSIGVRSAPATSNASPSKQKNGLGQGCRFNSPRKARPSSTSNSTSISASSSSDLIRATSGSRATRVRGRVNIFAEDLRLPTQSATSPSSSSNSSTSARVFIRMRSATLKIVGGVRGFRNVVQFYEIQRERTLDNGNECWSCIYRSEDGTKVDKHNYVLFDDVTIDESTLNNSQGDRKLRLAIYRRRTRQQHELISYVSLTMSQLRRGLDVDRGKANAQVVLKMEGRFGDDDGLGNVLVSRLKSRTNTNTEDDTGSSSSSASIEYRMRTISVTATDGDIKPGMQALNQCANDNDDIALQFRADHFLNKNFVSSLNDAPRYERKLFQKPAFISLH